MGYRIDYEKAQKQLRIVHMRLPVLTLLSFHLFLLLVNSLWPEGAEYLHNSLHLLRLKTAGVLNVLEADILNRESLTAVFSDIFHSLAYDPM